MGSVVGAGAGSGVDAGGEDSSGVGTGVGPAVGVGFASGAGDVGIGLVTEDADSLSSLEIEASLLCPAVPPTASTKSSIITLKTARFLLVNSCLPPCC